MAEGGDSPSLTNGSDVHIEFPCTPCSEDNMREEAVKYCSECQEYICTTCSRHHGRQKATRTHKLFDTDAAKQSRLVAKLKCHYHPDRDIEMYCVTHDMVYCVMCIAAGHRSCRGVNRIEDEPKSYVNQTEINQMLDETRNATKRIKALVIKQQEKKTYLEDKRNHTEEKLDKDEIRLIEHIRKLKRETFESVDKVFADMDGELDSAISASTNSLQNLEKTSEQLQSVAGMDAVQQFVQMKLMKKTVTGANKLHTDVESNGTKSVCFTENTDLITSVMGAVALGKVRTRAEDKKSSKPTRQKMKLKKEISVKMDQSTSAIADTNLQASRWSIDKDKATLNLIAHHLAISGYNTIVANWSNGAVYLYKDAMVTMELRAKRLEYACSVCVSYVGIVSFVDVPLYHNV